jgi:hypothetical protein
MYNNEELEAFESKLEELQQECDSYTFEDESKGKSKENE